MAKKTEKTEEVARKEWSVVELFYLENNRHLLDDVVAENLQADVGEVTLKRTEMNLTYLPKAVEPKSLFFDETIRAWVDNEGNLYDGPPVKPTDDKKTIEIKQNVAAGVTAGEFFGRNRQSTVMTPAAAQMSDYTPRNKQLPSSCVHKPKAKR